MAADRRGRPRDAAGRPRAPGSRSRWSCRPRSRPGRTRTIVRLLRDGAIGRVRHVQVAWDASGPGDPGDFWRWQRATSGENVMALGILAEAMARWLGQPEAVTAVTRLGPRRSDPARAARSRPTSPTTSWPSSNTRTT